MEVFWSDGPPHFLPDFLDSIFRGRPLMSLQIFHLAPQIFNWVEVWGVPRPPLKQFDAMFCVPGLCRLRAMRRGLVLHEEKWLPRATFEELGDLHFDVCVFICMPFLNE